MKKLTFTLLIVIVGFITCYAQNRKSNKAIVDQKRQALIIGNGKYQHGYWLFNPTNDADSMENTLTQLGFNPDKQTNVDKNGMLKALDNFCLRLKNCNVGLFYYAGHGVQIIKSYYLVPTDAKLETEQDVKKQCINVDSVLAKMDEAGCKVKIIILDANRDNPYYDHSKKSSGFIFLTPPPANSFIAYATSPGSKAYDGKGNNGLYTSAILQHIKKPHIEIGELFKLVRKTVTQKSGGRQIPWESLTLKKNFYFVK